VKISGDIELGVMNYNQFTALLEGKELGGRFQAHCPAHEDQRPSLTVTGGATGILVKCWAGCEWDDILRAMGLPLNSLFYDDSKVVGRLAPEQPEGIYDYTDVNGNLLYQVLRFPEKQFRQRQYKPQSAMAINGWVWGLKGVKRVLYKLPQLTHGLIGRKVWIAEGEKDVEELMKRGVVATCATGGANKWLASYPKFFRDLAVTIVRDKDKPGIEYAEEIRDSLEPGIARSVRVVEARTGKDAYDSLQHHPIEEAFIDVGYDG